MAFAARREVISGARTVSSPAAIAYCPMIDARRMEVFTALYDSELGEIVSPSALVLGPGAFDKYLGNNHICFFGNGSDKCKSLYEDNGDIWEDFLYCPEHVTLLAQKVFGRGLFTDIAYSEPVYLKDFYTHHK